MCTRRHIFCAVTSTGYLQSSGVAAVWASTLPRRADEARADGVRQVSRAAARREEIGNARDVRQRLRNQSDALHQRHSRPQFIQHRDVYRLRGIAQGCDALARVAAERPWQTGDVHRKALRPLDDAERSQGPRRLEERRRRGTGVCVASLEDEEVRRTTKRRAARNHANAGFGKARTAAISEAVNGRRVVGRRVVEVRRRRIRELLSIDCWMDRAYESRGLLRKSPNCKSPANPPLSVGVPSIRHVRGVRRRTP